MIALDEIQAELDARRLSASVIANADPGDEDSEPDEPSQPDESGEE